MGAEDDSRRWGALYDRCAPAMFDHCWAVLRDDGLAAVAVHDAFVAADLDRLADKELLDLWLLSLARSEALRWARWAPPTPSDPDRTMREWAAFDVLPPRDRALLDLHLRRRLDLHDLGTVIGVSDRHAYHLIQRARRAAELAVAEADPTRDHEPALGFVAALGARPLPPVLRDRVLGALAADVEAPPRRWNRRGFPLGGYEPHRAGATAVAVAIVLVAAVVAAAAGAGQSSSPPVTAAQVAITTTAPTTATTVAPEATTTVATTTTPPPPLPGALGVGSPVVDLAGAGTQATIDLRNTGGQDLTFSVSAADPALAVAPPSGTIPPGGHLAVTVVLDRSIAPEGLYRHLVAFAAGAAGGLGVLVTADINRAPVIVNLRSDVAALVTPECGGRRRAIATADVIDESALESVVLLSWQGDDPPESAEMEPGGGGAGWSAFTRQTQDGRDLHWTVTATDTRGNVATSAPQVIQVTGCS